jgi:predicted nucleotidyltransferase
MQEFLTAKRAEIAEVCRAHHVRRLAVFGSAAREDFDPERSDVDLLVEFEPLGAEVYFDNKYDLRESLRIMFGKEIDLLTWKSIRNPFLLSEVEATNKMLYAA